MRSSFTSATTCKPRLWMSADINYWRGGRTSVNGVEGSQTLQANSRFGVTGSVPLTRRQSFKISYSDGVIVRIGGNFQVLSVGYQYRLDREAVEMNAAARAHGRRVSGAFKCR